MGHRASYRLMPSSHALLIMLLTGATSLAWSQTAGEDVGQSLALAREALVQLDELAGTCLEEQAGTGSCTGFRQALDGELLVTYINSCATARRWRDAFVTMQVESPDNLAATRNTEAENLQLMIDVEYWCGTDALARTTENIVPAYALVKTASTGGGVLSRELQVELHRSRQEILLQAERQRLMDNRLRQQQRLQQQTRDQFQQLELELIRQQATPEFRRLPQ